MPTAQEIYASSVRNLPPAEQLRLAALILDELTKSGAIPPDSSDTWSDEDTSDLTTFSLQHAATVYPEEEDLV
jgi:hypothetical protein